MAQTDPKPDETLREAPSGTIPARLVRTRMARTLAGSASLLALSVPLMAGEARAESWQIIREYYSGGSTTTYRKLEPGSGSGITPSPGDKPAPGNNCPVPAFEILNPKPGEVRCVGFVPPAWTR